MTTVARPVLLVAAAGSLGLMVSFVVWARMHIKSRKGSNKCITPDPSPSEKGGFIERPEDNASEMTVLTPEQVSTFLRDGVLVVPGAITSSEVAECRAGLHAYLWNEAKVDVQDLHTTASGLRSLSSTNGSGGVLDIFYPNFKLKLAEHPKLFGAISELWAATFASGMHPNFLHRYGPFNSAQGYAYIDRLCFRVPDDVSQLHAVDPKAPQSCQGSGSSAGAIPPVPNISKAQAEGGAAPSVTSSSPSAVSENPPPPLSKNALKRRRPLQRSLTPHLDCCPADFHSPTQGGKEVRKWRPVQALVALTDEQVDPQKGGFEAAKGFHLEFGTWAKQRAPAQQQQPPPSSSRKGGVSTSGNNGSTSNSSRRKKGASKGALESSNCTSISGNKQSTGGLSQTAAPCVGEYTPIRPREDAAVLKRVEHVACRAGDLVLWDNRIPHANSLNHLGLAAREAVFLGFLPAVALNQSYARAQLKAFRAGVPPSDQWIEPTVRGPPPEAQQLSEELGQGNKHVRRSSSGSSGSNQTSAEGLDKNACSYEFSLLGRKLMAIDDWDSD